MASVGHVAVGMIAGRTLRPESPARAKGAMLLLGTLSLLPDLDYLGVAMGMPDGGPCGHRGATHSMVLPLLFALLAAWVAPRFELPRVKTALLVALVLASHGLLDAMTTAGRGIPMLWPLSFRRFAMPWRPIPDSPCGLDYLSTAGLRVATIELIQFLPLVFYALRPRPAAWLMRAATKTAVVPRQVGV